MEKLKKALNDKKLKYGTETTLKAIRKGEVKTVFVSKNCPKELLSQIERYSKIMGLDLVKLDIDNEELGAICKKPFSINMCYTF